MYIILSNLYIIIINFILLFIGLSLLLIAVQKDPIYAVFSFILTALCSFFFLILINAEFFALLILIIYIGVITILFLFVVIMYDLRTINIYVQNLLFNPLICFIIYKIYWATQICNNLMIIIVKQNLIIFFYNYSLDIFKAIDLFNNYYFLFLLCGLLLFIAMFGSVTITYPFYKQYI